MSQRRYIYIGVKKHYKNIDRHVVSKLKRAQFVCAAHACFLNNHSASGRSKNLGLYTLN